MGSALFLSNLRSQPLKVLLTRGYKEWFDKIFKIRSSKYLGDLPSPSRVGIASLLMSLILTVFLSIGYPRLSGQYFNFIDIYRMIKASDELELKNALSLFILSIAPLPILLFGNAAFDFLSIWKSYKVGAAMVRQAAGKIIVMCILDILLTFILAIIALYFLYYAYLGFYMLVMISPT